LVIEKIREISERKDMQLERQQQYGNHDSISDAGGCKAWRLLSAITALLLAFLFAGTASGIWSLSRIPQK